MAVSPEATHAAQALEELYREHSAEVYRYAYGVLGNRADAEDMTQSTFVNALRAMERGERPRKPGNWLITIAHNLARERFRRAQARPTEVSFDADIAAPSSGGSEDALSVRELLQALSRIPAPQRSALVMREFEGRPYAEIARALGITTSALETLLFRARRSVAEELENVVTCERAVQDLGRLQDGALGRKDRRRLDEHLRGCVACRKLQPARPRTRRVLAGLAWLPFPFPLELLRAGRNLLTTAASRGTEASAGGVGGTLALGGGLGAKVAAVAVATTVAGGIGYVGVEQVRSHPASRQQPARETGSDAVERGTKASSAALSAEQQAAAKRRAGQSRGTSRLTGAAKKGRAQATTRHTGAMRRTTTRKATGAHASGGAQNAPGKPAPRAEATTGKPTAPAVHEPGSGPSAAQPQDTVSTPAQSTATASKPTHAVTNVTSSSKK